jgi:undecaprenyl-diphosphatase
MVNSFDASILHFLNGFVGRSPVFDEVVMKVTGDSFVRGGPITALFWWAWFRNSDERARGRELITAGIAASAFALFVARALALALPFRTRPISIPALHIAQPLSARSIDLVHWSSFPSDHAVLYFALATTMFLVSRKVGIQAYCHALFIVCLPRVYIGLHYPSDVLVGALLGIGIVSICLKTGLATFLARWPMLLLKESPSAFYASFYLFTLSFATNFDFIRWIGTFVLHLVKPASHIQL